MAFLEKNNRAKQCSFAAHLVCVLISLNSCKFGWLPKAPTRVGANDSLIISESVTFERTSDQSAINLSFETRAAAHCKIGFYPVTGTMKTIGAFSPCVGRSATKFAETISSLPKDQLVAIVIFSWPSLADEKAGRSFTITEAKPSADLASINLLAVDLGAGRLELTGINSASIPSASIASSLGKISEPICTMSHIAASLFPAARRPPGVISVTSRGFVNSSATRVNESIVGGSFPVVQRQSTEWTVTARTTGGYGQLRITRPTLMKSAIFAGREQSGADDDSLEDVDPPALRLTSSQTFVASWILDGDASNSIAVLSISPHASFRGITCLAPARVGKITIPTSLISQIPANERLWVSLRIDSWQAIDDARWLVRVSDWKSLGVQRF